jgi:hypothetical protein
MSSTIIGSSISGVPVVAGTVTIGAVQNTEDVQIEAVIRPGSSAIEIVKLNDPLTIAHSDGQTVVREIKKSRTGYHTAMRAFARFYIAEHGDTPPSKQLDADDHSLACKYVETVIFEVDPNPGQVKLAEESGLSQSTWSRAFGRRTFWEEVNKVIDALWNLHRLVEDRIVRIDYEQEVATLKSISGKDDKRKNVGDNIVETKAIAKIDRKRRGEMDRGQLIRVIQRRKPSLKTEELEKLTVSQMLYALAVLDA